jgi:hypothetical protein
MNQDTAAGSSLILQPRQRLIIAWTAAILATLGHAHMAWRSYDTSHLADDPAKVRADNNFGHTLIDFAGQWVMARMIVKGHGHELYHRPVQRQIIDESFPRSDQAPKAEANDADSLFGWMIDIAPTKDGGPRIGGALYPPTHALLFSPLGRMTPRSAYRVAQIVVIVLVWLCGWLLSAISNRRVWWPVATLLILGYPGFQGTLHLAQNSILSLTLLSAGWLLMKRGWPMLGGVIWGFLAFKPTWLVAFALWPLLTRRWRMFGGMIGCSIALGLMTLPFVGIDAWFDWLRIGRAAANFYELDENWVFLSRDLLNVPRRWMLDFTQPLDLRHRTAADIAGWSLWGFVLGVTILVAIWRRPKGSIGVGPAFVGLGAWFSCFHFIYYDSLLSALPVFLLLTHTQWKWPSLHLNPFVLAIVAFLVIYELAFAWLAIDATVTVNVISSEKWHLSTKQHGTPWDTFALLALWAYCGIRTVTNREMPSER